MHNITIENEGEFNLGVFEGSTYDEQADYLKNFLERPNSSYSDYTTDWNVDEIIEASTLIEVDESKNRISASVQDLSSSPNIIGDNYAVVNTQLFNSGSISNSNYFRFRLNWNAYKTSFEETGYLEIHTENGNFLRLKFNNYSELKLQAGTINGVADHEVEFLQGDPDYSGNLGYYITNDIEDLYWEVDINYSEELNQYIARSRVLINDAASVWVSMQIGDYLPQAMRIRMPKNRNNTGIVDKKMLIKDIALNGYYTGKSYTSEIYDFGAEGTEVKNIKISGFFPVKSLMEENEADNRIKLYVYTANKTDGIDPNTPQHETILVPENYEQTFNLDSTSFECRYMRLVLQISTSRYYQNAIDSISLDYLLPTEQDDYEGYVIEELITSKIIGRDGGRISLNSDYYYANLYIPENALLVDTQITIKRLSSTDLRLADEVIGFEFSPDKLKFNRPVLLEVDYTGLKLNSYQSELGIKLAKKDISEDEVMVLDTLVEADNKKILTYINGF